MNEKFLFQLRNVCIEEMIIQNAIQRKSIGYIGYFEDFCCYAPVILPFQQVKGYPKFLGCWKTRLI